MSRQLRWMRLDNAAKIYPAARRRQWNNIFRLSANFTEPIDTVVMQSALDKTVKRFPSIAVRIRRGAFWYYLEELAEAPPIKSEAAYPLARISFKDIRKCAFRVICYQNRVAVEFYHSLTDGNGAMVFLKSLLAEYTLQKYGVDVPAECGILDRNEAPKETELEDSFLKNYGPVQAPRNEKVAYRLNGSLEPDGYLNLITGIMDSEQVLKVAKSYGVSVTVFLTSVMIMAAQKLQNLSQPNRKKQKPVRILVPVNLRKMFGSETLRNFALYVMPGIEPKYGDYSFEEVLKLIHHQMGAEVYKNNMAARIAKNVSAERSFVLKIMPLFIKNIAMKFVFNLVGERNSTIILSNLGVISLPEELKKQVTRLDFILGEQALCNNGCSALSYNGKLYINFLRTVKESELEKEFFRFLVGLGIKVKVESNRR